MEKIIIMSSVTYAMKAKRLLEKYGIRSYLTKSPEVVKLRGCGYGLVVDSRRLTEARSLIQQAGIRILDITQA